MSNLHETSKQILVEASGYITKLARISHYDKAMHHHAMADFHELHAGRMSSHENRDIHNELADHHRALARTYAKLHGKFGSHEKNLPH